MEKRKCKNEHPSSSWNKNMKARVKAERKATRHDPKKAEKLR